MRLIRIICSFLIILTLLGCTKKKPLGHAEPPAPVYPTICEFPAWSPDGSTIAYWYSGITKVNQDGFFNLDQNLQGIWFINPDGTGKSMFLQGGWLPDWSPDGQKLALVSGVQIYSIKINGDSLTQLTFEGENFFPDWSPDRQKMAFDVIDPSDKRGIYIMNSDGADKRMVPNTFTGRFPDWSPDGSQLVYVVYPGTGPQIFVSDTNGTNQIQLTFLKDYDNRYPVFSPDGKKIAFSGQKLGDVPQIWIMNSDGSDMQKLTTEGGSEPCWSPDGSEIAYVRSNGREYSSKQGQIWIMNADGSNKRQLTFDGW